MFVEIGHRIVNVNNVTTVTRKISDSGSNYLEVRMTGGELFIVEDMSLEGILSRLTGDPF